MPKKPTKRQRLIAVIARELEVPRREVKPSVTLRENLGADGLHLLHLLLALGKEFGREIPEGEGERFVTVQDVIDYVPGQAS